MVCNPDLINKLMQCSNLGYTSHRGLGFRVQGLGFSLSFLKEAYIGDYIGEYYRAYSGAF